MKKEPFLFVLGVFAMAVMVTAACRPVDPIVQTAVLTEAAEELVETAVVPEIDEITPELNEVSPIEFHKDDPNTLVKILFGTVGTNLDPAKSYEVIGFEIITNVYERLLIINRNNPNEFVPALAESWEISDDGKAYTFNIRKGVKFHEGQDLTPADVAYSFQRGLLQGGRDSPQWLLAEPFFGIGFHDVAELVDPALVDDPDSLAAADPAALLAACERTQAAIVADEAAGQVTFNLAQPWGPFLATISQAWGSIQDMDWAIEQGAWDGDCATWQDYYGRDGENTPLARVMNGTGPYRLESRTPGEEFVLLRNEDYWRTEPIWQGGPSGPAAIERVVLQFIPEWDIRLPMFLAGDADLVEVYASQTPQVDPLVGEICDYDPDTLDFDCYVVEGNEDAPFRLYQGYPLASRTDELFVFDINTEGGNPLLGSGRLDGDGIPPDFFQDIDVRKAFNYCFDWDVYIQETMMVGEAIQNTGVLIPGMIGYDQAGPQYTFDLEKCREHIEAAWDGAVAENGFRVQLPYFPDARLPQIINQILQDGFQAVDPKYQIEVIEIPREMWWNNFNTRQLPMTFGNWGEDIHDPHNWAQPFTVGLYAAYQGVPDEIIAGYSDLVDAGVATTDPEERAAIYRKLQQLDYDNAIAIRLAVNTGIKYMQRWVRGWYYNPIAAGEFFYALSID